MVHKYKWRYTNALNDRQLNPYKFYNENDLRNAVRAFKEQNLSYREALDRFKILQLGGKSELKTLEGYLLDTLIVFQGNKKIP